MDQRTVSTLVDIIYRHNILVVTSTLVVTVSINANRDHGAEGGWQVFCCRFFPSKFNLASISKHFI